MLIKGVNRKVIEISSPESAYFEKAILYVRPDMSAAPPELLQQEAKIYISGISPKRQKRTPNMSAILSGLSIITLLILIIVSGFFM